MPADGIRWTAQGDFSHAEGEFTEITFPAGDYGPYPILAGGIAVRGGSTGPGENPSPFDPATINDHTIELIIGGFNITSTIVTSSDAVSHAAGILADHLLGAGSFSGNSEIGAVELMAIPLIFAPWVEMGYNTPDVNPLNGGGTIRITTNAPTIDPFGGFNFEVGAYGWAILSQPEFFPATFTFNNQNLIDTPFFLGLSDFAQDVDGVTQQGTVNTDVINSVQADGVTPSLNFDPLSKYMIVVQAAWIDLELSATPDQPILDSPSYSGVVSTVLSHTNISATTGQATISIGLFTKTTDPISDLDFTVANSPNGNGTLDSPVAFRVDSAIIGKLIPNPLTLSGARSYATVIG